MTTAFELVTFLALLGAGCAALMVPVLDDSLGRWPWLVGALIAFALAYGVLEGGMFP